MRTSTHIQKYSLMTVLFSTLYYVWRGGSYYGLDTNSVPGTALSPFYTTSKLIFTAFLQVGTVNST